jgi:hypothetical protein
MTKPLPRRVAADTCQVLIAGELTSPHVGEWVELLGSPSIRERRFVQRMITHALAAPVVGELPADEPAADARERIAHADEAEQLFDGFCDLLARRITGWSLTDDLGEALPQPDGSGNSIHDLHTEEVWWLWNAYRGDIEAERKNGSSGSGAISASPREGTTRSRSKPS